MLVLNTWSRLTCDVKGLRKIERPIADDIQDRINPAVYLLKDWQIACQFFALKETNICQISGCVTSRMNYSASLNVVRLLSLLKTELMTLYIWWTNGDSGPNIASLHVQSIGSVNSLTTIYLVQFSSTRIVRITDFHLSWKHDAEETDILTLTIGHTALRWQVVLDMRVDWPFCSILVLDSCCRLPTRIACEKKNELSYSPISSRLSEM